jgi:hypothetical protein
MRRFPQSSIDAFGRWASTRKWFEEAAPNAKATSFPGSFLLWSKDPGGRWSRDLLKSSRFLISVVLSIWEGWRCLLHFICINKHDLYCSKFVLIMTRLPAILNVINNIKFCGTFQARSSEAGSYFTCKENTPHAPGLRSWARIAVETYISSTQTDRSNGIKRTICCL